MKKPGRRGFSFTELLVAIAIILIVAAIAIPRMDHAQAAARELSATSPIKAIHENCGRNPPPPPAPRSISLNAGAAPHVIR